MTFDELERIYLEQIEPEVDEAAYWASLGTGFSTSKHEEDAWEEIEMDNALMERGL